MASLKASSSYLSIPRLRVSLLFSTYPGIRLASIPILSRKIKMELPRHSTQTQVMKSKLHATCMSQIHIIAEAAADRAEMHAIIGQQRNNWNHLFLNCINSISLMASIMAGISGIPILEAKADLLAFKFAAALLFAAATAMMLLVNKIQPSQLAEEQRSAARLFRQLEKSIHTTLAIRAPMEADVKEAMERVLALDRAYPLPLLSGMLEKFPERVEPTKWWPRLGHNKRQRISGAGRERNGWSKELEEEMKGVLKVLKEKDEELYLKSGELALRINIVLAFLGPSLAGLSAVGACLIGTTSLSSFGSWPVFVAVIGGVLAAVTNSLEHGGQVGMVFELFRNCAGFYRQLEEAIEFNLEEDVEQRENGELFETKMALQLGRSVPELKSFASSASSLPGKGDGDPEYAGKLF
ncbi:probable F-box protein At4g22030 [Typha angustifolia]|uniref:probable F-box protein At4g22030 n=1 Tax=Typha angustifolia TaxID=59011 RepID=UPI003C2B0909